MPQTLSEQQRSKLREAQRYEAMARTCAIAAQAAECRRLAALARDAAR